MESSLRMFEMGAMTQAFELLEAIEERGMAVV